MQKIRLEIIGLTSGQSHGSYTLILGEENGNRKLPIIIGSFEAQAIAIEIEKIVPFRPMTHDLFVSFCRSFDVQIREVLIHTLTDGVFYAKLVCEFHGELREIDARTSDAIALAVRFKCPIYTSELIMRSAGIIINEEQEEEESTTEKEKPAAEEPQPFNPNASLVSMSLEQLQNLLDEAIRIEDYHRAALIRDEIKKRS
jgi:uncharacterized protein